MPRGRIRIPEQERFWRGVDRRSLDDCWPWKRKIDLVGYGVFAVHIGNNAYRERVASRMAYIFTHGEIASSDIYVCHTCDNRRCCNPAHLFLGSHKDNMADMVAKKRARGMLLTHCVKGHPYDEANTYSRPRGRGRQCRACNAEAVRRYKQRRSA